MIHLRSRLISILLLIVGGSKFIACAIATSNTESPPTLANPHYHLEFSEDDNFCRPLTQLYNELLADETDGATFFEAYKPEKFRKIGLTEPPKDEDDYYLVDFFNEGKPRIVEYIQQLGGGGATETTQILILKKNAVPEIVKLDASHSGIDPKLIDWDLPPEKERQTTARIFIKADRPYIIVNNYEFLPITDNSEVNVFKLNPDGLHNVCSMILGNLK